MPKRASAAAKIDAQAQWRRAKALELAIAAAPYTFGRGEVLNGTTLFASAEEIERWLMRLTGPAQK